MRLIPRSSALLRSAGKATNQRPAVIPSFQCSPGLLCKAPFSSTTVRGRADVEVDEGLPKDASENHHALSNAMKRLNRTVGDSAVKGIDKGGKSRTGCETFLAYSRANPNSPLSTTNTR